MRKPLNDLEIARYIVSLDQMATAENIALSLSTDFDLLRDTVQETNDRAPLTPVFDSRLCDIGQDNGFWILGRDPEGQVVHMQAMRLDHLQDETLADHLEARSKLFCSPHIPADTARSDFRSCQYTQRISGAVCYHGEMWLRTGDQYRGRGLSAVLPRLALAIALVRWAPDYIYGMVQTKLVYKGIPAQYGYLHVHPKGIRWRVPGEKTFDEWLVWLSREDLEEIIYPQETVPSYHA